MAHPSDVHETGGTPHGRKPGDWQMVKRKRRTSTRTPQTPADRGRFRRHPGVWLATLSTVVGVATGMFTLRDQVLPREAGTAGAVSGPTFQRDIGRVCDELNDNDSFRARDEKAIKTGLQQAKTTIAQRNALVDGVRRTASRSAHALASFNALEPPTALAAVRHDTETAWNRHLARLRDYVLTLDRASTRAQLVAALDHLATLRPAHARDSDKIRSGLGRLGDANCDLEPQLVTRRFTLPRLDTDKHSKKRTSKRRDRTSDPPATGPPSETPRASPAPPLTGPTEPAPPANQPPKPTAAPLPPANPPEAPGDG